MDITGYVEHLRDELRATAAAGDEAMVRSADRLVAALDAGVRLVLLEALSDAAAEITSGLDGPVVDVRLKGREPQFVITAPEEHAPERPPAPASAADDAGPDAGDDDRSGVGDGDASTARITLRLPDALKLRAEEAAARSRQSLNTWIVDAVRAATATPSAPPTTSPRRGRAGTQLSGWAR
ncbi:MAG: toxin-antitoxin system HicB family antitoxin [Ilumatobacteraceae bacterium]